MKIAIVNQPWNDCPPVQAGSISTWVYEVARRLARNNTVVVYARENDDGIKEEIQDEVIFSRISLQSDERFLWYLQKFGSLSLVKEPVFASRWYYLNYAWKVALDIRKKGCEIVHVNNFSQFVPLIRLLNPRIKIVLHMHCEWLTQLDKCLIYNRLRQTNLVIGCSTYITNKVRSRFPIFSDRCETVFNGVDVEHFLQNTKSTSCTDKKTILFVGRVSPEKGVHDLIEAFVRVARAYPSVCLRIVGPIAPTPKQFIVDLENESDELSELGRFYGRSYKEQLEELIPGDLRENVDFVGIVPHRDLYAEYRRADLLVNPSYSESFGMTLIEAMASGVPVIATRVGGMPEVVGNGNMGYLVAAGDVVALGSSMLELLQDVNKAKDMSVKGRAWVVKQYAWDKIAMNLSLAYSRLLTIKAKP